MQTRSCIVSYFLLATTQITTLKMLSRQLIQACRSIPTGSAYVMRSSCLFQAPRLLRQNLALQHRAYAIIAIKVPQMAESLTEGTLKQWNKAVGDRVEQDEEVASIETDKVPTSVHFCSSSRTCLITLLFLSV